MNAFWILVNLEWDLWFKNAESNNLIYNKNPRMSIWQRINRAFKKANFYKKE